jgi:hypothetical protein
MKKEQANEIEVKVKEVKRTKEYLQYIFSDPEKKVIAQDLAQAIAESNGLKRDQKAVASEFKSKIDGKDSVIQSLSDKINNGYEHRYIECEIQYHTPNMGMKRTIRLDTGEEISAASMTGDEMQMEFPLQ